MDIIEGAQQLGPLRPFNLQGVTSALEGFQEQLDMYEKYDWDFDHYLEEDLPAAVRCIFFFMDHWRWYFFKTFNKMKISNDEPLCMCFYMLDGVHKEPI